MARQDQLEIISPTGEVSFVDLDNAKGISNIGRHPENDIVLNSPSVGLFHAVLDHRQRPLKIMLLSSEGESLVAGQRLQLNVPAGMNAWDTLALGGYSMILFHDGAPGANGGGVAGLPVGAAILAGAAAGATAGENGANGAPAGNVAAAAKGKAADAAGAAGKLTGSPAGAKAMEAAAPAPEAAQGAMAKIAPPAALGPLSGLLSKFPFGKQAGAALAEDDASVGGIAPVATPLLTVTPLAALPADRSDDSIITEISGRAWTIEAGQTASFELSIVNGGDIVASFDIAIDGLEPSWVVITPPTVNLNEGQRATAVVSILPPRLPTSGAGAHFFSVLVTSPNYPGHVSQKGATLTINPYYEYAVGELTPREQSISYHKRTALETLTLVNRGNSTTSYRLDGDDPERGLSFEFVVPGHTAGLAKQAELMVVANTVSQVPIQVTPHRRRLMALRSHMYTLTVTTTPQEGQQSPRSVLAQLHASPLIGKWTILFTILALIALIIVIFRPTIDEFKADRTKVPANTPVTLTWRASPFANLRIDHTSTESLGALTAANGSQQVHPDQQPTRYTLVAENLLTRINSQWFGDSRTIVVAVDSVYPVARFTMVLPDGKPVTAPSSSALSIMRGDSVTLFWEVQNADTIILSSNGAAETIPLTDLIGKRTLAPDKDTIYSLAAANKYGEDKQLLGVTVKEPPTVTPTPSPTVPPPVIVRFDIVPAVITAGQTIQLNWEVANADTVLIQGIQGPNTFPPKGSIEQSPQNSTSYVLTAVNGPNTVPMQRDVVVNPAPTPTSTPEAPKITIFQLTRTAVVRGDPEASDIQLIWQVTGNTTNIEISGPDLPMISNQPPQGQMPIIGTKPTLFVISAFNGALVSSQTVNLNVTEPTPTPTPLPTATPPPPPASFKFVTLTDADASPKSGDVVQLSSSSPNTVKFQVVAGTLVKFSWDTLNAAKLTLVGFGDQPPTGSFQTQITQQRSPYQLLAANVNNQTVSYFIDITVKARAAPPAPTNVNGTNAPLSNSNTVRWTYPDISQIIGYRVYRAESGTANYTRVAGADENTLKPNVQQFTDNFTAPALSCHKSYYVVGVYTDISEPDPAKATKQTAPSAPVWASPPCGP